MDQVVDGDGHRLNDDERAALMGGNLSRVYGWAPDA